MNVEKGGLPGRDVWMGEVREQQSGFCQGPLSEWRSQGKDDKFSFGHFGFELPVANLHGDIPMDCLELSRHLWLGNRNLGGTSIMTE